MKATPDAPPAPESYVTFWGPLVGFSPPEPMNVAPTTEVPGKARDAYLEFTELTEGATATALSERS